MRMELRPGAWVSFLSLTFAFTLSIGVGADQKPNEGPVQGSLSEQIRIEVPAFRGLEPQLALVYSSESRSGFAGVGWGLSGFSSVVRTKAARGVPRFDSTDVFVLDGRELLTCPTPAQSPGCSAGGTHATKDESYLKIRFESNTNSWRVWGRDGTLTVLAPVYATSLGTLRWGQASTTDSHGNTTSYSWSCLDGDCYPDLVTFGPYSVRFHRESRTDVTSFATGSDIGWTRYRLRSVLVARQGTPIRAYRLTYANSAVTGRSILASVQQYGKDVTISGSGVISAGTTLPARTFGYQGDPLAGTLQLWPAQ